MNSYLTSLGGADPTSNDGIDRRIAYFLRTDRRNGASAQEVARAMLLPPGVVSDSLSRLGDAKQVMALGTDYYIHPEGYRACLAEVESRIEQFAAEKSLLSIPISDVRKGLDWPSAVWNRIQKDLERRNMVAVRGTTFVLQIAVKELDDADRKLMAKLINVYEETGFHSPRPDGLSAMLHAPESRIDRLLEHLCNEGKLVRVAKNVVLSYNSFRKAQDTVVRIIREKGVLNSADFKYSINSTRKYALAILDFLDSRRVTMRVQNDRKLNPDYQRYLL